MNTEKKHLWYHIEPTVLLLSVLVSFIVWFVASSSERTKTNLEYVRLAIGVLQPPEKDKQPQKELRTWAVQILQHSSPVPLSPTAVKALIEADSNLPYVNYGGGPSSSYEYDSSGRLISRKQYDQNGNVISNTELFSPKPKAK